MTMENMLRRLVAPRGADAAPAARFGPGGAAGLALARAAQRSMNLPLVIRDLVRATRDRDALVAELDPAAMLVALGPEAAVAGLVAVEPQLRCAVVEAQTLGAPRAAPAEPHAITGTDAAMITPLLCGLLDGLAPPDAAAPGNSGDLRPGARLDDPRAAALILPETVFEILRFEVEIGPGSGRIGGLMVARSRESPKAPDTAAPAWDTALRDAVLQAPAELEAVLHRMRLPARALQALEPGQLLMLPGVDLGAVRLEDARGCQIARVRLGQRAGLRAVRLAGPGPEEAACEAMSPPAPPEIPSRPAD